MALAMALPALWSLTACSQVPDALSPVSWYRDLTGVSRNDDKGTERNTENLEAGGKEPFPNLASVPPPPDNALSASERAALENSLVDERQDAKSANDLLLIPAAPERTAKTPAPAAPVLAASPPKGGASAPPASAPGVSSRGAPAASPSLAASGATPAPPASAAAAPPPLPTGAAAGAPGPTGPAVAAPQAATAPQHIPTAEPDRQVASRQRPGSRAEQEAPPQEASLVSPSVRIVPEGEPLRGAPPPPELAPRPAPEDASPAQMAAAAAPKPPTPPPPAAALPMPAAPPAPPAATLSATEPPARPAAAALPLGQQGRAGASAFQQVADISFDAGSADLLPANRGKLAEIAKLQKDSGGIVRIIGYAEPAPADAASNQELTSFGLALARAKAVAEALGGLGVPEKQFQVEVAPQPADRSHRPGAAVFIGH